MEVELWWTRLELLYEWNGEGYIEGMMEKEHILIIYPNKSRCTRYREDIMSNAI